MHNPWLDAIGIIERSEDYIGNDKLCCRDVCQQIRVEARRQIEGKPPLVLKAEQTNSGFVLTLPGKYLAGRILLPYDALPDFGDEGPFREYIVIERPKPKEKP